MQAFSECISLTLVVLHSTTVSISIAKGDAGILAIMVVVWWIEYSSTLDFSLSLQDFQFVTHRREPIPAK